MQFAYLDFIIIPQIIHVLGVEQPVLIALPLTIVILVIVAISWKFPQVAVLSNQIAQQLQVNTTMKAIMCVIVVEQTVFPVHLISLLIQFLNAINVIRVIHSILLIKVTAFYKQFVTHLNILTILIILAGIAQQIAPIAP